MRARVFKFLVYLKSGHVYCGKNQDAEIYFYQLFPFFLFSISHSNVKHKEICVKDFSVTTAPRILKVGINVGHDLLYGVKENQHAAANHCLYLSIFLSLQLNFSSQNSHSIHLERGQVYCGKEMQDSMIKFCLLFPISFFHLPLKCNT